MQAKRLAIFGITGRMGQSILRALLQDPGWRLCGALASAHSAHLGHDAAAAAAIAEARVIAGRLRCQPLLDRAAAMTPAELRVTP